MSNYLLDTHALIWFCEGNEKLSNKARLIIENNDNELFLSFASLWEIVIKLSLGRLESYIDIDILSEFMEENAISILENKVNHLKELRALPFYHDDPFDRFIIAQAISEKTPVISKDSKFKQYNVEVVW